MSPHNEERLYSKLLVCITPRIIKKNFSIKIHKIWLIFIFIIISIDHKYTKHSKYVSVKTPF